MKWIFPVLLFVFGLSYGNWEGVKEGKGYYYVEIEDSSFEEVNTQLLKEIKRYGWDVIHTINVDKTADRKEPYKTHLLCKSKYLKKGVERFKPIGIIIPCKMAVFAEGNTVKIMVEDIKEYGKVYGVNDKEFLKVLDKVNEEMKSILRRTYLKFTEKN
ncbi:DUF302 domain-containing protein [Persephonella sp.]